MKSLTDFINKEMMPSEPFILEMATVASSVKMGKEWRRIAIHGIESGDRENPHVHIYNEDDKKPYNQFNFEISLTDILSKNEINLIKMRDQNKGILKNNRSKCSWDGYNKLKNDFEDWLYSPNVDTVGEFIDNLDALIYWYNRESYQGRNNHNPLLKYIQERGMKVLKDYWKYFSEEDKKEFEECFKL